MLHSVKSINTLFFIGEQHAKTPKLMKASVLKTGLSPWQKDDLLRRWEEQTQEVYSLLNKKFIHLHCINYH